MSPPTNEAPKPKLTAADLDAIEQRVLKHAAIDHPIAAVSIKDCRDMIAAAREGLEAKQHLAEAQSACEVVRADLQRRTEERIAAQSALDALRRAALTLASNSHTFSTTGDNALREIRAAAASEAPLARQAPPTEDYRQLWSMLNTAMASVRHSTSINCPAHDDGWGGGENPSRRHECNCGITAFKDRVKAFFATHPDPWLQPAAVAPPTEGALRAAMRRVLGNLDAQHDRLAVVRKGLRPTPEECAKADGIALAVDAMESALAAKEPAGEARVRVGSPAHVALWNAINEVVYASGGRDNTSGARMNAVVNVESAIAGLVAEVAQPTESSDARERGLLAKLREWCASQREWGGSNWKESMGYTIDRIDALLAEAPREDAKAGALVEEVTAKLRLVGKVNVRVDGSVNIDNINGDIEALRDAVLAVARAVEARR